MVKLLLFKSNYNEGGHTINCVLYKFGVYCQVITLSIASGGSKISQMGYKAKGRECSLLFDKIVPKTRNWTEEGCIISSSLGSPIGHWLFHTSLGNIILDCRVAVSLFHPESLVATQIELSSSFQWFRLRVPYLYLIDGRWKATHAYLHWQSVGFYSLLQPRPPRTRDSRLFGSSSGHWSLRYKNSCVIDTCCASHMCEHFTFTSIDTVERIWWLNNISYDRVNSLQELTIPFFKFISLQFRVGSMILRMIRLLYAKRKRGVNIRICWTSPPPQKMYELEKMMVIGREMAE